MNKIISNSVIGYYNGDGVCANVPNNTPYGIGFTVSNIGYALQFMKNPVVDDYLYVRSAYLISNEVDTPWFKIPLTRV